MERSTPKCLAALCFCTALAGSAYALEMDATGKVTLEGRAFFDDGAYPEQSQNSNLSVTIEPDLYWETDDRNHTFYFKPFLRLDQHDDERTHADIRELSWTYYQGDWELRAGLRKVFWGVTEFQHLVDVINQTDGVEDIDNEEKLGQPMINLSLVRDWGIVDLYLLPGFRERTFAGADGRLRGPLVVATNEAEYESGADDHHTDVAVRWSHTIDAYDIGAHIFHGTNRDPILSPLVINGQTVLVPYYEQMTQFGVDLQATLDSWLWKAEVLWRDTDREDYWATQAGFEYTFYGVNESDADLGVLLEYGWDERGSDATSPFQNDLSLGARLTLNDAQSSELLAGIIYDLDYDSTTFQIEASRRLGAQWKVSLDLRYFDANDTRDLLTAFNDDSHIQLTIERYF